MTWPRAALGAVLAGSFSACVGGLGAGGGSGASSDASAGSGGTGAGGDSGTTSTTVAGAGGGGDDVCARWKNDRAGLTEGVWSGSVASCTPGDDAAPGRDNALTLVNLYRWLDGLPPVALDAQRSTAAQACALMMQANGQLSHTPPMSWKCYTSSGAQAAGSSNIATAAGVGAVDLYMVDPGNPMTMGHRRWILSNSLGPIGVGSASAFSCMWVIGGSGAADKPFTAWPPAGKVPYQAWQVSFQNLDQTGWTIQSDPIQLAGAKVKVTDGASDLPVDTVDLLPNYGANAALRFTPKGWQTAPGHTYHVTVTGASQPIAYDVAVVDCN